MSFSNSWLENLLVKTGFSEGEKRFPQRISPPTSQTEFNINLHECDRMSLFELMNLFLLIDEAQSVHGRVYVYFEGVGPRAEDPIMDYDIWYKHRKNVEDPRVARATKVYKLISFCNYFGLFESLSRQISARRVVFSGLGEMEINRIQYYKGAKFIGSSVMSMKPIYAEADVLQFKTKTDIQNWISELEQKTKSAPVIADGDFSRFFGYQLVQNIIQHSGIHLKGEHGAIGAVAMRVIKEGKLWLLKNDFPEQVFKNLNPEISYIEICVGDRGVGICETLKNAYKEVIQEYSLEIFDDPSDVLAFAFDEIGSSKNPKDMVGGVHGLHRILKSVSEYNGVLKVCSGTQRFIYDGGERSILCRGLENIGVYPNCCETAPHIYGTQIQIIIPLNLPVKVNMKFFDFSKSVGSVPKIKVVPASDYVEKIELSSSCGFGESSRISIGNLIFRLQEEPYSSYIVYDLSGLEDQDEERMIVFLRSQESILSSKRCAIIGLESGFIENLIDRDLVVDLSIEKDLRYKRYLDILDGHKVIPVIDKRNWNVKWLGLGRLGYMEKFLNYLIINNEKYTVKELAKHVSQTKEDEKQFEEDFLLLRSKNPLLFIEKNGKNICTLTVDVMKSMYARSIYSSFTEIVKNYKCEYGGGGYYQLPSRSDYTEYFFQSTALLQDSGLVNQVAECLSNCATVHLKHKYKELMLLCSTAPSELLARKIADNLRGVRCNILNLGHLTRLDEEDVILNNKWNIPALYITDVLDTGKTTRELINLLKKYDFNVLMVLAFLNIETLKEGVVNFKTNIARTDFSLGGQNLESIPCYNVIHLEKGKGKEIQSISDTLGRLNYIEPFSLEVYSYESLSGIGGTPRDIDNKNKLLKLDGINALRVGHWVFGHHHFKATTCLNTLFNDNKVSTEISRNVVKLCSEQKIDLVISPLHSHIGYIVPKIKSIYKKIHNSSLEHVFCIAAKVLKRRSFYVLPQCVKKMIKEKAEHLQTENVSGLNLLFLDDAIASGRTFETFLRALILEIRKQYGDKQNLKVCPINSLHAYTIIDRQGLSKNTFYSHVREISISGNREWLCPEDVNDGNEVSFKFRQHNWIDLELPVENRVSCQICKTKHDYEQLRRQISTTGNHPLLKELELYISRLKALPIESAEFQEKKSRKLPSSFTMGRFGAADNIDSVELLLLEFYSHLSRGVPFRLLFEKHIIPIMESNIVGDNYEAKNLLFLKEEILVSLFDDWDRIYSQYAHIEFCKMCEERIHTGSILAPTIFREAAKLLARIDNEKDFIDSEIGKTQTDLLINFVKDGIDHIIEFSGYIKNTSEPEKKEAISTSLDHLNKGVMIFCMLYRFYSKKNQLSPKIESYLYLKLEKVNDDHYAKPLLDGLHKFIKLDSFDNKFLPSFFTVLENTVRYFRSNHDHLVPALIDKIASHFDSISVSHLRSYLSNLLLMEKSFRTVHKEAPFIFATAPVRAQLDQFLNSLKMLIDLLQEYSEASGDTSLLKKEIVFQASGLRAVYPNQSNSLIFKSVIRTQIRIVVFKELIEKYCAQDGIVFEFSDSLGRPISDDETIMAPEMTAIAEVVKNVTVYAKKDTCCDHKVIFYVKKIESSDSYDKTVICIRTNFLVSNTYAENDLRSGSGLKELYGIAFDLFDVSKDIKIDKFSGHCDITFTFISGIKHRYTEG